MNLVESRIKQSSQNFIDHVWPRIKGPLGGGELIPVEQVTDDSFAKKCLDMLAGIDAWHVQQAECRIRGIACRCQHPKCVTRDGGVPQCFQTITVRKDRKSGQKTEFDKLKAAVTSTESSWLRPALFVQAYFADKEYATEPRLRGFGIARVEDVIDMIGQGVCKENRTSADWDQHDDTGFYVVKFSDLKAHGKKAVWCDVK